MRYSKLTPFHAFPIENNPNIHFKLYVLVGNICLRFACDIFFTSLFICQWIESQFDTNWWRAVNKKIQSEKKYTKNIGKIGVNLQNIFHRLPWNLFLYHRAEWAFSSCEKKWSEMFVWDSHRATYSVDFPPKQTAENLSVPMGEMSCMWFGRGVGSDTKATCNL